MHDFITKNSLDFIYFYCYNISVTIIVLFSENPHNEVFMKRILSLLLAALCVLPLLAACRKGEQVTVVSGHRVLIKSGPENRCRSARGTSHMGSLEFPPETGLILRCTWKAGNPFLRRQGNRLSCRDQEGRSGSDAVVPGPLVFPSREHSVSGNFCGRIKGVKYRFALKD